MRKQSVELVDIWRLIAATGLIVTLGACSSETGVPDGGLPPGDAGDAATDAGDAGGVPDAASADPPCDAMHAALLARLDDAFPSGSSAPGRIVGVETPRCGRWFGATGHAVVEPETEMTTRHRMNVGAVTEMFVAAVVLQLVSEGRLSLEDTLERWHPEVQGAPKITIRALLSHRSGIPDPMQSPKMSDAWLGVAHTPEQLIALVADEAPECAPGECHVRSATNFVLLASIVEAVTERTLAQVILERIIHPLGLSDTIFLPVRRPSDLAHSYSGTTDVSGDWHPSNAYGSASLVSSARDLLTWSHALFEGHVVDAEGLTEMTSFESIPGEGDVGLALSQHGGDRGAAMTVWYHGGAWEAFSVVAYVPDLHASVVVLENVPAVPQGAPRDELAEMFGMASMMSGELAEVAPAPGCDAIHARAQEVLQQRAEEHGIAMPGSVLGLDSARCGRWLGTTGYSVLGSVEMPPDAVFGVSAVTETVLTAAVLRLVERGSLSLDDTLPDFGILGFRDGDRITVRHLLAHRSGVGHYLNAVGPWTNAHTPAQLVGAARGMAPACEPGACFTTSASDPLLLALILEEVTGQDVHDVLREIIESAGPLSSMTFLDEPRPSEFARCYDGTTDVTDQWHWSNLWGSYDLVSNAGDVLTWMRALLRGRVLSPRARAWMLDVEPIAGEPTESFGLGVWRTDVPEVNLHVLSTGAAWESVIMALYVPELDLAAVLIINARAAPTTSWIPNDVLRELVIDLAPRFRALPHFE